MAHLKGTAHNVTTLWDAYRIFEAMKKFLSYLVVVDGVKSMNGRGFSDADAILKSEEDQKSFSDVLVGSSCGNGSMKRKGVFVESPIFGRLHSREPTEKNRL